MGILISKNDLLVGSKMSIDGDYYKISNDDRKKLLEIFERK